jgi:hypothetical protein
VFALEARELTWQKLMEEELKAVRIVGGENETQSLTWKKLPNVEEKKPREKRSIMWCIVQGTRRPIYIGKGDRDRVISSYPTNLPLTLNL